MKLPCHELFTSTLYELPGNQKIYLFLAKIMKPSQTFTLKMRKKLYPIPIKHIQLSPFIFKASDCFPFFVGKLSFHNMKEF